MQMLALRVVHAQCACQPIEHRGRRPADRSALEPGVVLDAHTRECRRLAATQAGHPPVGTARQPDILGFDASAARHQEVSDL